MDAVDRDPVRLFWTAGFDSTYRLLDLTEAGATVQPYYVIDLDRPSFAMEVRRMARIQQMVERRYAAAARLLPLSIRMRTDLRVESDIQDAWMSIRKLAPIGAQYAWLAQFCRDAGFGDGEIELCRERDEPPAPFDFYLFEDPRAPELRLIPGPAETLFRHYRFPIAHLTKAEMREDARARGFLPILSHSWFCHSPILEEPCGYCKPCKTVKRHRLEAVFSPLGPARRLLDGTRNTLRRLGFGPRREQPNDDGAGTPAVADGAAERV